MWEMVVEYIKAFVVGGLFCVVGQLLIDYTKLTPARILVLYVVSGVVLGGLGLYQPIIDFAGAGATVPLTGFGALLAKGTRDAIIESGVIGILSGGLVASAAGVGAAIFFSLVAGLCAKPKQK